MASLHLAQQILDIIWPVGSLYFCDTATNPNTKFGGTWVQLKGGFLYGSNATNGANAYSTGNGTGTSTNNHSLTVGQLPNHKHAFYGNGIWQIPCVDRSHTITWGASYSESGDYKINNATDQRCDGANGEGHSHKIPYIACSIWRRTA